MKTPLLLPLFGSLLLLTAAPSRAAVTFTFDYSDPTAALWGPEGRTALDNAATNVASHFTAYTANVTIAIYGFNDPLSDTLASAGINHNVDIITPDFNNPGPLARKIRTNGLVDENGADADAYIEANMGHPFGYSAAVPGNQFDFTSVMMHEIGHTLGFGNTGILENGGTYFPNAFTPWDRYMVNGAGTSVLTELSPGLFDVNVPVWLGSATGGSGNGIYLNGPNALAANGGNPVPLYSPATWSEGSSALHLDYVGPALTLMTPGFNGGTYPRTYSAIEIGIFRDMGFTLMVPEPGTAALALCGFALVLRRRRSGRC